eukprot:TRINITY_DN3606_c1_g1_i1.p1 TRINITY_DN3606_c1_g1~~TRINITY_DN3606_c1_g1_i1.p1  ORF type:complete len:2651 (+),score=183.99 TRINITY_DN3606_c1_g1_i1:40-7992(+)
MSAGPLRRIGLLVLVAQVSAQSCDTHACTGANDLIFNPASRSCGGVCTDALCCENRCAAPPGAAGSTTVSTISVGLASGSCGGAAVNSRTVCSYTSAPGYDCGVTSGTRGTCVDGAWTSWTSGAPSCAAITCPFPSAALTTLFADRNVDPLGVVTTCDEAPDAPCALNCATGWRVNTAPTLNCNNAGQWEIPINSCLANECKATATVANQAPEVSLLNPTPAIAQQMGYADCDGKFSGQTCTVTCPDEYAPTGTTALICDPSNSFDALATTTGATCEPIPCGASWSSASASAANVVHLSTSAAIAGCNEAHETPCTLTCNLGFGSPGTPELECAAPPGGPTGTYQVNNPCTRNTCIFTQVAGPDANARYDDCHSKVTGDTCTVTCNTGYVPVLGNTQLTLLCGVSNRVGPVLAAGAFPADVGAGGPQCDPVRCPMSGSGAFDAARAAALNVALPTTANLNSVRDVPPGAPNGGTFTLTCAAGYVASGTPVLDCVGAGTWQVTGGACVDGCLTATAAGILGLPAEVDVGSCVAGFYNVARQTCTVNSCIDGYAPGAGPAASSVTTCAPATGAVTAAPGMTCVEETCDPYELPTGMVGPTGVGNCGEAAGPPRVTTATLRHASAPTCQLACDTFYEATSGTFDLTCQASSLTPTTTLVCSVINCYSTPFDFAANNINSTQSTSTCDDAVKSAAAPCSASCATGYESLTGGRVPLIECNSGNTWTVTDPCQPMVCGLPFDFAAAQIVPTTTTGCDEVLDAACQSTCEAGFRPMDSGLPVTIDCIRFGGNVWNTSNPCVENTCAAYNFPLGVVGGVTDACTDGIELTPSTDDSCTMSCGAGWSGSADFLTCASNANNGEPPTTTIQCQATCGLHSCGSSAIRLKNNPSSILCPGAAFQNGTCTDELCCAGVMVDPEMLQTSEELNEEVTFEVWLVSPPTGGSQVVVPLGNPRQDEVTMSTAVAGAAASIQLTFTTANWNQHVTVTITGRDDTALDGTQTFSIDIRPVTSTDISYQALDPRDVLIENVDNDTTPTPAPPTPGPPPTPQPPATPMPPLPPSCFESRFDFNALNLVPVNLSLCEPIGAPACRTACAAGYDSSFAPDVFCQGTDTWMVTTTCFENICSPIALPDGVTGGGLNGCSEGQMLTTNTNSQCTVTCAPGYTGSPDSTVDCPWNATFGQTPTLGNIVCYPTCTTYTCGDGLQPRANPSTITCNATGCAADVCCVGIIVEPLVLETSETGADQTFYVSLSSMPAFPVQVNIKLLDTSEGLLEYQGTALSHLVLSLDSTTWSTLHNVTVRGQDDSDADGHVTHQITFEPLGSLDDAFDGLQPPNVTVRNLDDETNGLPPTPVPVTPSPVPVIAPDWTRLRPPRVSIGDRVAVVESNGFLIPGTVMGVTSEGGLKIKTKNAPSGSDTYTSVHPLDPEPGVPVRVRDHGGNWMDGILSSITTANDENGDALVQVPSVGTFGLFDFIQGEPAPRGMTHDYAMVTYRQAKYEPWRLGFINSLGNVSRDGQASFNNEYGQVLRTGYLPGDVVSVRRGSSGYFIEGVVERVDGAEVWVHTEFGLATWEWTVPYVVNPCNPYKKKHVARRDSKAKWEFFTKDSVTEFNNVLSFDGNEMKQSQPHGLPRGTMVRGKPKSHMPHMLGIVIGENKILDPLGRPAEWYEYVSMDLMEGDNAMTYTDVDPTGYISTVRDPSVPWVVKVKGLQRVNPAAKAATFTINLGFSAGALNLVRDGDEEGWRHAFYGVPAAVTDLEAVRAGRVWRQYYPVDVDIGEVVLVRNFYADRWLIGSIDHKNSGLQAPTVIVADTGDLSQFQQTQKLGFRADDKIWFNEPGSSWVEGLVVTPGPYPRSIRPGQSPQQAVFNTMYRPVELTPGSWVLARNSSSDRWKLLEVRTVSGFDVVLNERSDAGVTWQVTAMQISPQGYVREEEVIHRDYDGDGWKRGSVVAQGDNMLLIQREWPEMQSQIFCPGTGSQVGDVAWVRGSSRFPFMRGTVEKQEAGAALISVESRTWNILEPAGYRVGDTTRVRDNIDDAWVNANVVEVSQQGDVTLASLPGETKKWAHVMPTGIELNARVMVRNEGMDEWEAGVVVERHSPANPQHQGLNWQTDVPLVRTFSGALGYFDQIQPVGYRIGDVVRVGYSRSGPWETATITRAFANNIQNGTFYLVPGSVLPQNLPVNPGPNEKKLGGDTYRYIRKLQHSQGSVVVVKSGYEEDWSIGHVVSSQQSYENSLPEVKTWPQHWTQIAPSSIYVATPPPGTPTPGTPTPGAVVTPTPGDVPVNCGDPIVPTGPMVIVDAQAQCSNINDRTCFKLAEFRDDIEKMGPSSIASCNGGSPQGIINTQALPESSCPLPGVLRIAVTFEACPELNLSPQQLVDQYHDWLQLKSTRAKLASDGVQVQQAKKVGPPTPPPPTPSPTNLGGAGEDDDDDGFPWEYLLLGILALLLCIVLICLLMRKQNKPQEKKAEEPSDVQQPDYAYQGLGSPDKAVPVEEMNATIGSNQSAFNNNNTGGQSMENIGRTSRSPSAVQPPPSYYTPNYVESAPYGSPGPQQPNTLDPSPRSQVSPQSRPPPVMPPSAYAQHPLQNRAASNSGGPRSGNPVDLSDHWNAGANRPSYQRSYGGVPPMRGQSGRGGGGASPPNPYGSVIGNI